MPSAPQEIVELVERFARNLDYYHRPDYNETTTRVEFINPFFTALGWDVDARQSTSPHPDVIHEAHTQGAGARGAPDYAFRIGGKTKFYVEAKKPSVDIAGGVYPAYQLRCYGWTLKLPFSILTDFEEFSVYDCRAEPRPDAHPAVARQLYVRYDEYGDRWNEIARLFAREVVERGDLERYAEEVKPPPGLPVDEAFLREIETWRTRLAEDMAQRNPALGVRNLNYAVQMTIDRIIFLRIAEDRDQEPQQQLNEVAESAGIYPRLLRLFYQADQRYNSGLFHFAADKGREAPDLLAPTLAVGDDVLGEIIRGLYPPHSPYAFRVFSVDILGQVYERFLGSVIRLTSGHQAKVEQKPEVRKAGGVYYTPKYIVDYIVEHTVGALLGDQGSGIEQSRPPAPDPRHLRLRILDPACGSGSFLLGAYEYLLDYHLHWYVEHRKQARREVYQGRGGEWFLTTEEKKRILLNCIYGVDIDPQAVEVTKLSLLLKVLEGESQETLAEQMRLWQERALPDLANNIKCGNSLIGPDFYAGQQLAFDEEEAYRVNAFDWDKEFEEIMRDGGFDAVIGNPPYGAIASEEQVRYYRQHYACSSTSCDSFALFIEQSTNLLRSSGLFGMIVQSALVSAPSMHSLREVFIDRFKPVFFVTLPYDVFNAYVDTVIVIAERLQQGQSLRNLQHALVELVVFPVRFKIRSLDDFGAYSKNADASKWFGNARNEFLVVLSDKERTIIDKMNATGIRFSDIADIQRGVTPFHTSEEHPPVNARRAFTGTVRRYKFEPEFAFIQYDETLAEYKPPRYFYGPRLLLRELISRQFQLQACYVEDDFVTNKSMQSLLVSENRYNPKYLLGLLNSRLLSWYFLAVHSVGRRDDFPKIVLKQTRELPFRPIDFSASADLARHDQMVALVERMLDLHRRLSAAQTPPARTLLQHQIEATDAQIDRLVYELYGLTEEEIGVVEAAS